MCEEEGAGPGPPTFTHPHGRLGGISRAKGSGAACACRPPALPTRLSLFVLGIWPFFVRASSSPQWKVHTRLGECEIMTGSTSRWPEPRLEEILSFRGCMKTHAGAQDARLPTPVDYCTCANIPSLCKLCRLVPDLCDDVHVSELGGWEAWPPASSGGRNVLLRDVTNMKGAFRNVFFLEKARD